MKKLNVLSGLEITKWAVALLLVLALGSEAGVQAGTYFRFDNDGQSAGGNPSGSPAIQDEAGAHNADFIGDASASTYSADVPGPVIHDPVAGTNTANSLSFDYGVDSEIRVLNSTTLPTASSANVFTVEMFLKTTQSDNGQIFEHRGNSGPDSFLFGQNNIQIRVDHDAGTGNFTNLTDTGIGDGEWHHFGYVWDGTDVVGYIDYVEIGRLAVTGGWSQPTSAGEMSFGKFDFPGFNGHDFVGMMDEIRISDTALGSGDFLRAVPEPSALALLLSAGAIALSGFFRRKR